MSYYYRGLWTGLLISEASRLKWRRLDLVWNTWSLFYLAIPWVSMPLAACSRLCNRNSAQPGVFAKHARSSALAAFIIVPACYRLFLTLFIWNYFLLLDVELNFIFISSLSYILLIIFWYYFILYSYYWYGTKVSPWKTPVTMSKNSISPSGKWTIILLILKSSIIAVTVFFLGGGTEGN